MYTISFDYIHSPLQLLDAPFIFYVFLSLIYAWVFGYPLEKGQPTVAITQKKMTLPSETPTSFQ